jgi:hypothetical protein
VLHPDRVHRPPTSSLAAVPLGKGVAPCPSSWLLRRELIDRVGGWEEHVHPVYEDQGFLGKAYLETTVWVSSRCWDRYRRHPGQLVEATDGDEHGRLVGTSSPGTRGTSVGPTPATRGSGERSDGRGGRTATHAWPRREEPLAASAPERAAPPPRAQGRGSGGRSRDRAGSGEERQPQPTPVHTIAFVMWGDLFEDFYDTIGVSLERFRAEYSGTWLFGYVEALAAAQMSGRRSSTSPPGCGRRSASSTVHRGHVS